MLLVAELDHAEKGEHQRILLGHVIFGARLHRLLEGHGLADVVVAGLDRGQVGEHGGQVAGEGRHLLLLELQRHQLGLTASLQVEDALSGRTDGVGRQPVDLRQVEGLVHEGGGTRPSSSPVQLTVSTLGPSSP